MSLSNDAKATSFKGAVLFCNTLQSHFVGRSRGEHVIFFDLNKDIVEVLIGEIMFNHFVEEYHNNDEDFIEGDKDECRFILDNRRDASVTSKKHAMSVFKL